MDKPSFTIRPARREDCAAMMTLIRELAAFERAPDEVTVSEAHFEESGFGGRPVWWALVACAPAEAAESSAAIEAVNQSIETAIQDPLLARLSAETPASSAVDSPLVENAVEQPSVAPFIQLDEPVTATIPEPVQEAMPLMEVMPSCENVVGFALWYVRYSTWKGRRMYLEDIIVTEAWRGRGVGTALMDGLIATAMAEGLGGISWQVLDWNERAMKFYERYGARFDSEWVNAAIDV